MKKILLATACISLAFFALTMSSPACANDDILINDFEASDYGDWTVEGAAFGSGPAKGTLEKGHALAAHAGAARVAVEVPHQYTAIIPELADDVLHILLKLLLSGKGTSEMQLTDKLGSTTTSCWLNSWRLLATKLDLRGALYGKRPVPSDEIWLRDSDIVLIPKNPLQNANDLIEMVLL